MTNHPNRARKMHHFSVMADRTTGSWDISTAKYLGAVVASEHNAKVDTDLEHYDQHDGEALDRRFWDAVDAEPTSANVAITVIWMKGD